MRVYVDINASDFQGEAIGGIRADYLLEVRGHGGRITSNALYAWTGRWSIVVNPSVMLAKNATDFEGSVPVSTTNQTQMVFAATEWSGVGDATVVVRGFVFAPAPASKPPSDARTPEPRRMQEPVVLDVSGNGVFWFRDIVHATETACNHNKVAMSTKGSGPAQTITLTASQTACWYIDGTSGQTIPTGSWETLLDVSVNSTTYEVRFEVWNKNDDTIAETIGSCTGLTTGGNDVQCLASGVPEKVLTSSQVIRIVIRNVVGGTISIEYDDGDSTGDSRATVPIPEFDDIAIPLVAVLVVSILLRRRRRKA
ncbi:MAG: hypothetical protein ACREDF_09915 [Thermoplasmata archaeon]